MKNNYLGQCSCGAVKLTYSLPVEIKSLQPRACDCDFCTSRKIAYLSHPEGLLTIKGADALQSEKQGSEQAEFISCKACENVIAATYQYQGQRIGALVSKTLDTYSSLKKSEPASPKLLSATDKIQRWKNLWSEVKLT